MKRATLLKAFTTLALVALLLTLSASPSHAASFNIRLSYNGCNRAIGAVDFSGVTSPSGGPIAIEVDIAPPGSGVLTRWSGSAQAGSSGSEQFDLSWGGTYTEGGSVLVDIWVYDADAGVYIPDPSTGYYDWAYTRYACTNVPSSAPVTIQRYFPAENRVAGVVKYDTPIYSSPDLKSNVVGTLTAGQTWYFVGTAHNGTWYQVFVAGPQYAWVPAKAISVSSPVPRGKAPPPTTG